MAAIKKITPQMIREHFGKDAQIRRKLTGGFNVTTLTGGDVDIQQERFDIHAGGEDTYRAVVSLLTEAWDQIVVDGPDHHIIAMMAHGAEAGANVIPELHASGAGCLRFLLAVPLFLLCIYLSGKYGHFGEWPRVIFATAVTGYFWDWMKAKETRAARQRGQHYRFQYPNVHGGQRDASHDDARNKEWL